MFTIRSQRSVRCYRCQAPFVASARAIVLTCPHCYQRVHIEDVIVRGNHHANSVETCGRILVAPRGWLMAGVIIAAGGIEVLGRLHAKYVQSGPVFLAAGATWRGSLLAPSIVIEPGASVEDGLFDIGPQHEAGALMKIAESAGQTVQAGRPATPAHEPRTSAVA
ncbi:MAG: polymer-forming cytoskeletal protein [Phycisphaerales bacterium]